MSVGGVLPLPCPPCCPGLERQAPALFGASTIQDLAHVLNFYPFYRFTFPPIPPCWRRSTRYYNTSACQLNWLHAINTRFRDAYQNQQSSAEIVMPALTSGSSSTAAAGDPLLLCYACATLSAIRKQRRHGQWWPCPSRIRTVTLPHLFRVPIQIK